LSGNPARPDDIAAQAGPTGGGHKQQPGPERWQQPRSSGCPALLPVASKDGKAVERIESLRVLCVFVPLWFGP